jgi:hypothetical protein
MSELDLSDITNGSVAHSTVGFVDVAERTSLGSGTLVKFGDRDGIVTCAHVVDALRKRGKFGVMYFSPRPAIRGQRLVVEFSHCVEIEFDGAGGPEGPDLAFLILPPGPTSALAAVGTITNGHNRFAEACRPEPEAEHVIDAVSGVVAEWTQSADPTAQRKLTIFTSKAILGRAGHAGYNGDFDLVEFDPDADSGPLPSSFEGMSGGGLWRLFINEDIDGLPRLVALHLLGVAYFQTAQGRIICHGPRSIYEKLMPRLAAA